MADKAVKLGLVVCVGAECINAHGLVERGRELVSRLAGRRPATGTGSLAKAVWTVALGGEGGSAPYSVTTYVIALTG